MKIDRVILSSDNNELYYPFWNPISKIYKENFDITPTLIWIGDEKTLKEKGLSEKYGDIVVQQAHPEYQIPWQTTWALFHSTKYFLEDTCIIMGIDQVPLSDLFLVELIKNIDEDHYVMMIDDAYRPTSYWKEVGGASPSSYHIAKGKIFNQVYEFENYFEEEIIKVYKTKDAFWSNGDDKWGIDESYSCKKLRQYEKSGGRVHPLSKWRLLQKTRVDCHRTHEAYYDSDLLKAGNYSEAHLCRPYHQHKDYIDTLFSKIPKFNG